MRADCGIQAIEILTGFHIMVEVWPSTSDVYRHPSWAGLENIVLQAFPLGRGHCLRALPDETIQLY